MNYCNPTWNNGGELSATDIAGLQAFYGDSGATPTCDDGYRNQDEDGIDCGGVCGGICPDGNEVAISGRWVQGAEGTSTLLNNALLGAHYGFSDSCSSLSPHQASLIHVTIPSSHSTANHLMCPNIAFYLFTQRIGLHEPRGPLPRTLSDSCLDFAIRSQARHFHPAESRLSPADCAFASDCSPPRIIATQLSSANKIEHLL
ncbi:MAG: hypothetical protein JXR76_13675 [Deltaproteobacteria bacterium]|nr:hypothetical protein [Deltaproteobacteria bacterium]